jgi:hypothetical protein
MTNEKIQKLAEFFYHSDNANDVPLRIAITTGQYGGADLSKQDFIELMTILIHSKDIKADLLLFLGDGEDE